MAAAATLSARGSASPRPIAPAGSVGRVNLLCHPRARASFSLTLSAGAMLLDRIGRLGGAAAAGGGRDALSYGVSFATTDRTSWLGWAPACFLSGIPWRVGAEESGAA